MPRQWPLTGRAEETNRLADALRDPATSCILLTGDPGVGKTRLARHLAKDAERHGWIVRWVVATTQTQAISLGAIAPLLPERLLASARRDGLRLLQLATHSLTESRPARDLIVVDDAPLLDELSAGLVQQLVAAPSSTRLLLTARSTELPGWLSGLARDDRVDVVHVGELSQDQVDDLLERVLDGWIDLATKARLWTHSRGNALYLRQLLRHGLDTGALSRRDGVWRWHGPAGAGDLRSLLADQLMSIPTDQLRALECVAVGEPLPVAVARRLAIEPQLAALSRRGLIDQAGDDLIRVAHPLYGSVARDGLPAIARREIERRLARDFVASGRRSGTDLLRIARWQLDNGDSGDADVMVAAAQRALPLDPALAERLARAACQQIDGLNALHTLAMALFDQRRFDEAAGIYRRLLDTELSIEERTGLTLEVSMIQAWCQHDAVGAIAELAACEATPELAPLAPVISGMRGAIELFRGNPAAAIDVTLPITADAGHAADVRGLAALTAIPALVVSGRTGPAVELAEWARSTSGTPEFSGPLRTGPTYAAAQLEWEYVFALRWAGRINEAVAAARACLRSPTLLTWHHPQSYGLANAALGAAWLAAGRVRDAVGALRVAADMLRASDTNGTLVSCLADLACAEAAGANFRRADDALDEATGLVTPATCLFESCLMLARARVAARQGFAETAAAQTLAAARVAHDRHLVVFEAECLEFLIQLGRAGDAWPPLTGLVGDTGLVSAMADHARAAVARDGDQLSVVAERFAQMGAQQYAAQIAASAARLHRRAGRSATATRAAARSRAYSENCPGAPRPFLLTEPVPLTGRELEIVTLAAQGLSNQLIAQRLVVSVRTVESHLQHAYGKLGIHGRRQLQHD